MRSTSERGLAVAICLAFGHFSRRLVRRVKPARAMISLMMSMMVVSLCATEQARANDVTVTIMGQLTSGSDTTGVFGKPNPNLTGAPFTLVYVLNDMNGQSCGDNFSCIDQSVKYGLPMTTIMLSVNNGTPFLFGQFRPASILQLASRQLNYRDLYYKTHAAYLVFNETEDEGGSLIGSADVHANVYINPTWAQQNWPQESSCWEGALPLYKLFAGDSLPSGPIVNTFGIDLLGVQNGRPVQEYLAKGNLAIQSITIMPGPNQPPAQMCFVGHVPR